MTTAALGLIGVNEEETRDLLRALAGVLFLGQVRVPYAVVLCICVCFFVVCFWYFFYEYYTCLHVYR